MSVAVALLFAAAPAAMPPASSVENEIVVIGQKLEKRWKGRLTKTGGQLACKTTKSTGDTAIDAIGCDAMLTCTSEVEPQVDAIAASNLSRRERSRRIDEVVQSTKPCLDEYRATAVARLAASRAQS